MPKATKMHENSLINEKSPYLLQHARNPVDWRAWSAETLELARREDKPLFISIGYSTCHWCHVMERESFEDPETARVMNENFVCIKVDREERPDIDSLYMKAVQALTGQGGWPLNVFATPSGEPFYGGTYFPPREGYGLPPFVKVVEALAATYRENRDRVTEVSSDIISAIRRMGETSTVVLSPKVPDAAVRTSARFFDPEGKGFGPGPKFPMSMFLGFLIKHHRRTGDAGALEMARDTLVAMALGGIHDHLGGGFHRYSVDARWEVPHFEKMLYDNAQLLGLYSEAFSVTGDALYREAATGIARYLMRDMLDSGGGFYAAEDADSEGREGVFYLWSPDEVREVLGGADGERFCALFNVTEDGNCEGRSTLWLSRETGAGLSAGIGKLKERMFEARARRPRPATDRKVIAAWNGLAAASLARASAALGEPGYLAAAESCADFALSMRDRDGRLLRYSLDGHSGIKAGLEDYALLGAALLAIYEANGGVARVEEAEGMAKEMLEIFEEPGEALLFDTGSDQERLFVRTRDLRDTDLPSGNSAAAAFFLALARATGTDSYLERAREMLASIDGMDTEPLSHGHALSVLEDLLSDAREGGGKG